MATYCFSTQTVSERVVGIFCKLYNHAASWACNSQNVFKVIKLADPRFHPLSLDAWCLEHEDRQASGSHFLPAAEQRNICVFRQRLSAQKHTDFLQSIKDVA